MTQQQKYTWLIHTILRANKISFKELSDKWERNKELSDCQPLHRATFNRWRDAIYYQFGIIISCQRVGGYLYYIENPEMMYQDKLKKWMLDSFEMGNLIIENLSLKDRIIVDQTPSGYKYLANILSAMRDNKVLDITYISYEKPEARRLLLEPYCVKLFDRRWYMLCHNPNEDTLCCYALDRIDRLHTTNGRFTLPDRFSASDFYSGYFGIVTDNKIPPQRIVLRAYKYHKEYMKSLPLHHSQRLLTETDDHADFELHLSPTYDFIMRLLHVGALIEVLEPSSLRLTMREWINDMSELYKH